MTHAVWNWRQPDWPRFAWDRSRLARAEELFLLAGGVVAGAANHLRDSERDQLVVEMMSQEAMSSSAIEGEVLDRASVQSSIRQNLGLEFDHRRARPAEQGMARVMVELYRGYAAPLSHEMLFDWHRMVMNGRTDLADLGGYRTHGDPMRVVSGPIYEPRVHFEAPPSAAVTAEMERFVGWFNDASGLSPLTRAGLAHLYFVSIHPFEDGNGRLARALTEKALAQGLRRPALTAVAATMLARRSEYYDALEAANKRNEVTGWLAWFAGVALESQARARVWVEFVIAKARLLEKVRGVLNPRQETVLLRMLREGPEGFEGGLSAKNYVGIAKTSTSTATRDLADMVEKGAVVRTGELRHARYWVPFTVGKVPRYRVMEDGAVVEGDEIR